MLLCQWQATSSPRRSAASSPAWLTSFSPGPTVSPSPVVLACSPHEDSRYTRQCSARKLTKLMPDSDCKLRLVSVCSKGKDYAGPVTANAGTDRVRAQTAQSEPSDDAAPTALRHFQRGGNQAQEQQG